MTTTPTSTRRWPSRPRRAGTAWRSPKPVAVASSLALLGARSLHAGQPIGLDVSLTRRLLVPTIREPKFRSLRCFRKGGLHRSVHEAKKCWSKNAKGRVMKLQAPWFKPAAWGVVVGAIGTMIIGFSWLGWTLGSTAERLAVERANSAVVVALTPSCVARFM